ncbi:Bug family tripartite tricarboxylate transporter substrate binding protein [Achromobacter kerstersii]
MKKLLVSMLLGCATISGAAVAGSYPEKPIKIIVPFGAGNLADTYARLLSERLAKTLQQPVIVENRPGATTIIGAQIVAKAPADGYTLFFTASTTVIAAATRKKLPFDPIKDFSPIGMVVKYPYYLIATRSLPVESVQDLIQYGKAHPGRLNYGTLGEGSGGQFLGETLKQSAGFQATHVPYKTTGEMLTALQTGELHFAFDSIASAQPLVAAEKLRGFAITSGARFPAVPDVPTMAESGVKNYEFWLWLGLLAPANTPAPVIEKLNAAVNDALRSPEIAGRVDREGMQLAAGAPDAFAKQMRDDLETWRQAAQRAGVALD